jgi:hypothetical protein
MFSTYQGAKRCAHKLQAALRVLDVDVQLSICRHAIARGGGYRDWNHLHGALATGVRRPAPLDNFGPRAWLSLPEQAIAPAKRWLESQISLMKERAAGVSPCIPREDRDWHVYEFEYAFAMDVIHQSHTPLLRPGSGRGMRLRQSLVHKACMGFSRSRMDHRTLTLTVEGDAHEIFRTPAFHPHFTREFDRLLRAGIFEWSGCLSRGGTLVVNPPSVELVRGHIEKCRRLNAEYWRMDAEFRHEGQI